MANRKLLHPIVLLDLALALVVVVVVVAAAAAAAVILTNPALRRRQQQSNNSFASVYAWSMTAPARIEALSDHSGQITPIRPSLEGTRENQRTHRSHRQRLQLFSENNNSDDGITMKTTTPIDADECDDDNEQRESSNSRRTTTSTSKISPSSLDLNMFQRRRDRIQLKTLKKKWSRPPYNPFLDDPIDFVLAILQVMQQQQGQQSMPGTVSSVSLPSSSQQRKQQTVSSSSSDVSAAMCLLESSTPAWRNVLWRSVRFRPTSSLSHQTIHELNEQVAPTLQKAMSNPTSQYAILLSSPSSSAGVDAPTSSSGSHNQPEVVWHFPTDPVEYDDGSCWVEARLRRFDNDELLVVTGWSLKQRSTVTVEDDHHYNNQQKQQKYSPWLLDGLDWQDFREDFRPGIGREEWERICG